MRWSSGFGVVAVSVVLAGQALAVDGVIEINQTRALAGGVTASDTPGWPVTIDAPGSYRLTGNLDQSGSAAAIEITASSVSLDLNGFQISGQIGSQGGIVAGASIQHVSVANGRILVMDAVPISLPGLRNSVDRMVLAPGFGAEGLFLGSACRLSNSDIGGGVDGTTVGHGCIVRNVRSGDTDGDGLVGGDGVTVVDSSFSGNEGFGLALGDDASVNNVTATNNDWAGIQVGANSTVMNSRVFSSGALVLSGCGAIEAVSGTLIGNVANENSSAGICMTGAGTVVSNTALANSGVGLDASSGTGYASNTFNDNNGGDANPQVSGGLETGGNVCGGDTTCP